ncbi:MAG: class I SAM-dependent methyltransferase [Anaerolineales bacterium]
MFNLSAHDLETRILGCGDGPAAFNAAMRARGGRVVSCDPLYQFSARQIGERIEASYQTVMEQTRQGQDKFVWNAIKSLEALGQIRMDAMRAFLADYEQGKAQGRYVCGAAPALPFAPGAFDLALSSHFLFLYSDNLSLTFHQETIADLLRVAKEVRIFPVLTYNADVSPHLAPVCASLKDAGYQVAVEAVPYEFQRGGDKMLKVSR